MDQIGTRLAIRVRSWQADVGSDAAAIYRGITRPRS